MSNVSIYNSVFNQPVVVSGNAVAHFSGCEFKATGANKKDQATPGLKAVDSSGVEVVNSKFSNTGYSAVNVLTSGKVVIENNEFDCSNVYNPIEGTVSTGSEVSDVTIKGNSFNGVCGNNYVNFYKVADGAVMNIEGNNFNNISSDSEVLRLSNPANHSAIFNVKDNNYNFGDKNVTDYTAFLMCQDYTSKSGNKQDFSLYTVNIENLHCNSEKVTEDYCAQGKQYFVYQDGVGIIEDNNPNVIFK